METVFIRDVKDYTPYFNPVEDSLEQYTNFFAEVYNISKEESKSIVLECLKNHNVKNPTVRFKSRQDNGDLEIEYSKLTHYINQVKRDKDLIAPSFTVYKHPDKEKSIVSELLDDNVKKRKVNKKLMFENIKKKIESLASYYDVNQKANKIENNSASGGFGSNGTALYNPSAHYTLTSTTRCVSGIGNAISESIVGGNKYFRTPQSLFNYIATIVSIVDKKHFKYIIDKYGLYCPTAEEVMKTVTRVTRWYWVNPIAEQEALDLLNSIDPIYRAAFTYINDLWNLKEYNEVFVRDMIDRLHKRVETGHSPNPLDDLDDLVPGTNILAHYVYALDIQGLDIKYEKMVEDKDPLIFKIASTAKNIKENFLYFKELFNALFVTDILPTNIAYIQDMHRFNIVLSDTDSTCCSYSKWVEWFYGGQRFDSAGIAIAGVVMTITTEAMNHNLRVFSRNLNFGHKTDYKLRMKNEFFWPVFVTSDVTKHYYANTMIQEGTVFDKLKLEKKGVHFIASTVGGDIVKRVDSMMVELMEQVARNEKISITAVCNEIADLEIKLLNDIDNGLYYMFRKDTIKEEKAYRQSKEESKYINHILWMDVFSERYGVPSAPPYVVYTIGLTTDTKKKFNQMLLEIEKTDPDIAKNLRRFCQTYKKEYISTLRPPMILADSIGIPKCFKPFIDKRETVLQTLRPFDYILKTLGFYRKPGKFLYEMGFGTTQVQEDNSVEINTVKDTEVKSNGC